MTDQAGDQLIQLFADTLSVQASTLNDDSSPANTADWDSLATVNLTLAIEQEFSVKLTTQEIMSMKSIGLARSVLRKKGAAI